MRGPGAREAVAWGGGSHTRKDQTEPTCREAGMREHRGAHLTGISGGLSGCLLHCGFSVSSG